MPMGKTKMKTKARVKSIARARTLKKMSMNEVDNSASTVPTSSRPPRPDLELRKLNTNLLQSFSHFNATSESTKESLKQFNAAFDAAQTVHKIAEERLRISVQDALKLQQLIRDSNSQVSRTESDRSDSSQSSSPSPKNRRG